MSEKEIEEQGGRNINSSLKDKVLFFFSQPGRKPALGAIGFILIALGSIFLESFSSPELRDAYPRLGEETQLGRQYASLGSELKDDIHLDLKKNLTDALAEKQSKILALEAEKLTSQSKIDQVEKLAFQLAAKIDKIAQNTGQNYSHLAQNNAPTKANSFSVETVDLSSLSKKNSSNYLPAGTFIKAKILGGVDVATNPSAQKNPQPLLLHVIDWANLPSLSRHDIEHCRITAHAWGDLSAERAYARTENLACILKNGEIIDTKIHAFIVDDSGKNGIRGDVVERHEGALITQAFLSKFIGTIGGASQDLAQNFIKSQEDISWKDAVKSGGMSSLGASTKGVGDTLEKYFVERLNELSPVIQVFANKDVHVVLTQGVDLSQQKSIVEPQYEIH